jgi:hypothetical protein
MPQTGKLVAPRWRLLLKQGAFEVNAFRCQRRRLTVPTSPVPRSTSDVGSGTADSCTDASTTGPETRSDVPDRLAGFRGDRGEMLSVSSWDAHQPIPKLVPDTPPTSESLDLLGLLVRGSGAATRQRYFSFSSIARAFTLAGSSSTARKYALRASSRLFARL